MLPIYIVDPGSSSALVMFATPSPVLFKLEAILKVDRKGVAWHDSASKEVSPHPVVGRFACARISRRIPRGRSVGWSRSDSCQP